MSAFPILKTGAVFQYPADKGTRFSTHVIRFVDGSEQRFRDFGSSLRRWVIRYDQLDESELASLRAFFREQRGAAGTFSFTDPWDATEYAACSLESDEMVEDFVDIGRGRTMLVVKENRG
jgi:hypothetical protein